MGSIVSAIEELQKDEADRPVIVCNFKLAGSIPRDVHVSVSAHEELADIFNTVNINTACAIRIRVRGGIRKSELKGGPRPTNPSIRSFYSLI